MRDAEKYLAAAVRRLRVQIDAGLTNKEIETELLAMITSWQSKLTPERRARAGKWFAAVLNDLPPLVQGHIDRLGVHVFKRQLAIEGARSFVPPEMWDYTPLHRQFMLLRFMEEAISQLDRRLLN